MIKILLNLSLVHHFALNNNFLRECEYPLNESINIKKNLEEKKIKEIVFNSPKAVKHLKDKKVIKTIFVKNKIINYIVSN